VAAFDNPGHGLQDRQQFVLGGLQDDHGSTFGGFYRCSSKLGEFFTTACIFAVFWTKNGLHGAQIS
jgi:hypothetical protein